MPPNLPTPLRISDFEWGMSMDKTARTVIEEGILAVGTVVAAIAPL